MFPPRKNSSKQEIWSSQFFRDLSQVVRRTPWDTSVHLYFPVTNYSQAELPKIIIFFGPKSEKNDLNNSQNHVWSVNRMSVIFARQELPKIILERVRVGNPLPDELLQ